MKKHTNQILLNVKTLKANKLQYRFLFYFFILFALFFVCILFFKIYQNYSNINLSKKLNSSYSVSTLYADNEPVEISQTSENSPFVIGIIQIDKINLNYSILSICNSDLLSISVCRFAGPMPNEVGNLCIAGHNYINNNFFGRLNELDIGDEIKIFDLSGNCVEYSIYDIYETNENDTSCTFQETNGTKIVTLITCNNISGQRLILHAKEIP